jgi:hypothetical protein
VLDDVRAGKTGKGMPRSPTEREASPFTLTLRAGTYSAHWYNVKTRKTKDTSNVTVDSDRSVSFTAPFAETGPAVLYLKHAGM